MSLIVKNIKSIQDEWNQLMKKKIKKTKRKNQYSLPYIFNEQVQQGQKQEVLIVQTIPRTIPTNNVFRLRSNVQFFLDIYQEYSLGYLGVDPHSNNYKVGRVDKRKNLIIFTLNPISRPITPPEVLVKIFESRNKDLANSFTLFDKRNSEPLRYSLNTQEEVLEYEKQISQQPWACYINIYQNGFWKTFQKVFNTEMLKVLAVTEEMLLHYANETKLIPISAYFDPHDQQLEIFSNIFKSIVKQEKQSREYINYNGDRFSSYLSAKCFYLYDEITDQYYEYQYFITQCDKKWSDPNRAIQNEIEYFNLKSDSTTNEESSALEHNRRCGYKLIQ